MMFGIRTPDKPKTDNVNPDPKKSPDLTEKAGPSHEPTKPSKVRRSIGEWETGITDMHAKSPTATKTVGPAPVGISRPKAKAALSQESMVTRRASAETAGSPLKPEQPRYPHRTAEARACLTKAKLQLGSARNLKTEIRIEVTQSVERLFQLVKEAELERMKKNKCKSKEQEHEESLGEKEVEPLALPLSLTLSPKKKTEPGVEAELLRRIEEHSKLMKESTERMEGLKEAMEKQQRTLETMTYADAAAGPTRRQPPGQTALHSVVITSKDETETGEEVLSRIRSVINAKEGGIMVDRVRKAKDRKVIVGCKTVEERQKVTERLRKAEVHLSVEEIKNKDPLLLLRDVFQYNTNEDVLSAFRKQNGGVFKNLGNQDDRMEIRYRKKTRNPQTCHIVMRVSPQIWKRAIDAGAVHIDLQKVRVADQSPLVQCSLCLGYGHGRRFCKQTVEKCSHCGGPHMRSQCNDWLDGVAPKCCNCTHAKLEQVNHSAFSEECAIRRKWDALARATIAYC